jgi:hypothetical protein
MTLTQTLAEPSQTDRRTVTNGLPNRQEWRCEPSFEHKVMNLVLYQDWRLSPLPGHEAQRSR